MSGKFDSTLNDVLLPWIISLVQNESMGLSAFRSSNRLGRPMVCDDPYNLEYIEIMDAISKSRSDLR